MNHERKLFLNFRILNLNTWSLNPVTTQPPD